MIINDLDGYYIVFDTKNWNTELDTLIGNSRHIGYDIILLVPTERVFQILKFLPFTASILLWVLAEEVLL